MPTYEYSCSNCNSAFELRLRMSENELPLSSPCPKCNSEGTIEQVLSTFALGDPIRMGIRRPDAGWNDVLSKVKQAHPNGYWDQKKYVPTQGR